VYAEPWVAKLAAALDSLGAQAGLVAHGVIGPGHGIDELTTATANCVQGCGRLREVSGVWRAEEYGLVASPFAELQGGGLVENVAIVEALLAGRGARGLVDTIALNVAVALWIVGKVATVREGIEPARDLLLGGAVRKKITATREFYLS
jgi:anthranilate phosphoribosyltransferase